MRERTALLAGLVAGGFLGLAYLLAGPLILIPGAVVGAYALARHPSPVALGAAFVGFGAAWLLLIGQMSWTCTHDPSCTVPGFTVVWLGVGVIFVAIGVVIGLAGRAEPRHR